MKICILGSSGMAGHVVYNYLKALGYDTKCLSGSRIFPQDALAIDIVSNPDVFEAWLDVYKDAEVVINCVGVLLGGAKSRPDRAAYLNAYLPLYLEHRYANTNTKVIHLSTDCVYSGFNGPYKEDAPYDGTLVYDRSKALGEIKNNKDLTFRMSIIGPEIKNDGEGLFHWFMQQSGTINGYTDVIWNGVTTIQLAQAIDKAIRQNLTGLYHLVPAVSISKYRLLEKMNEVFNRKLDIKPILAPIPTVKTLINTRTDFAYEVPDYPYMIQEMKWWIDNSHELYAHDLYKERPDA